LLKFVWLPLFLIWQGFDFGLVIQNPLFVWPIGGGFRIANTSAHLNIICIPKSSKLGSSLLESLTIQFLIIFGELLMREGKWIGSPLLAFLLSRAAASLLWPLFLFYLVENGGEIFFLFLKFVKNSCLQFSLPSNLQTFFPSPLLALYLPWIRNRNSGRVLVKLKLSRASSHLILIVDQNPSFGRVPIN